jgi:hypothetical protein
MHVRDVGTQLAAQSLDGLVGGLGPRCMPRKLDEAAFVVSLMAYDVNAVRPQHGGLGVDGAIFAAELAIAIMQYENAHICWRRPVAA